MKRIKHKGKLMKEIERRHESPIEEILRRLYVDEDKSITEIVSTLNISYVTVVKWLRAANIVHRRIDFEGLE